MPAIILLPKKKALRATKANREYFQAQKVQLEARNLERRKDAEAVARKLSGQSFVLIRQAGDRGQLYGSVSPRDVAAAAEAGGFTIDRGQVQISQAIKAIGLFTVPVVLHPEVRVTVTVNVARSEDEAERQARGEDVLAERTERGRGRRPPPRRYSRKAPDPSRKMPKPPRKSPARPDPVGVNRNANPAPQTAGI